MRASMSGDGSDRAGRREETPDPLPEANSTGTGSVLAEESAPPASRYEPHDPGRIRGDALRRSLRVTTLGWLFGAFWFTAAANGGVPTRLGEFLIPADKKDAIFGLLGAMPFIGVLFMVPGSLHIQWVQRRKRVFLWALTLMRAMYLLMALVPWVFKGGTWLSAYAYVGLVFIAWATGQYGGQAWTSWMADLVPQRVRGKYFARRSRLALIVMMLTAVGLGLLLDYSDTAHFLTLMEPVKRTTGLPPLIVVISAIFFISGIAGIIDIQCFHKVDEPPMHARAASKHPIKMFFRPLRDGRFMRFVGYLTCVTCADAILGAFIWVFLLDMLDSQKKAGMHSWLTDHRMLTAYVLLQIVVNIGGFAGLPVWGRVVDRLGRKPVIFWGSFLHTLTLVFWVIVSPGMLVYGLAVQLLAGAVVAGRDTANFNLRLSFNRNGGPAYETVVAVCTSIGGALSAGLAGQAAKWMQHDDASWKVLGGTPWEHPFNRYSVLFGATVLLRLIADFVLLPLVTDDGPPVRRRDAIRHIVSDAYGNVHAALAPLRNMELGVIPERLLPWRWAEESRQDAKTPKK